MSEPRPFAGYRNYFGSHYPRNRSYQKIIRNEYDEPSAMRPHQAYRMRDIYHEDHGVSDDTRKLVAKNEDKDETKGMGKMTVEKLMIQMTKMMMIDKAESMEVISRTFEGLNELRLHVQQLKKEQEEEKTKEEAPKEKEKPG